jgi:hypothetical protein
MIHPARIKEIWNEEVITGNATATEVVLMETSTSVIANMKNII